MKSWTSIGIPCGRSRSERASLADHEGGPDRSREATRPFRGPAGLRDGNALESALARPVSLWRYEEADPAELAAAYAFGLARNHAFIDGDRRIALVAMITFLRLNSVPFRPDQAEATAVILGLAAGEIDESGLTRWICDNRPKA